jgi:hypothetical protein
MRRSLKIVGFTAATLTFCGLSLPKLSLAEDVIQQTGANSTSVTESHDSNGNSTFASQQSRMVPTVTRTREEVNEAGQTEEVTQPLVQERRESTVEQTVQPDKVETETKTLPPTLIQSKEKIIDTSSKKMSSSTGVRKAAVRKAVIVRRPVVPRRRVAARPIRRSVASVQNHERIIERDNIYQQPVVIEKKVIPGNVTTTTSEKSSINQSGD